MPGAKSIDCRAMCVGPKGTVWSPSPRRRPKVDHLLHLVSYRAGDKAPRDHGPVAVTQSRLHEFTDDSGKPLPFHGGFHKTPDGRTTTGTSSWASARRTATGSVSTVLAMHLAHSGVGQIDAASLR